MNVIKLIQPDLARTQQSLLNLLPDAYSANYPQRPPVT
jgi:hypothetical protein